MPYFDLKVPIVAQFGAVLRQFDVKCGQTVIGTQTGTPLHMMWRVCSHCTAKFFPWLT